MRVFVEERPSYLVSVIRRLALDHVVFLLFVVLFAVTDIIFIVLLIVVITGGGKS